MKRAALASLLLFVALPATADPGSTLRERLREDYKRWQVESSIERTMVLGHLRGYFSRRPAAPDFSPRQHGKGRLEVIDGVPVLYLEGTPEEMGRQHGALLRREMGALQSYVRAFVGRQRLPAAKRRAELLFREHCTPDHLAEVQALADAAGLPLDDVFFAQVFTDLYRAFACSTLAAPSSEGTFLARNLDFPSMGYLERYSVVVVARPTGKQPYVSIGWPGLVGVLSGQNEGLALSVLVVHDEHGARSGMPFQLAFRRVLEEATRSEEAEALLRATPITVTNNLMLVDTAGDARALELHPDEIVTRRPNAAGRLVATNHFVSKQRRQDRASFSYLSSRKRYDTVWRTCPPGDGPVALDTAKRALSEAGISFTVQSMVFLPREGELEVAFTQRSPATKNGRWVRLKREQLLGAKVRSFY